MIQALPCTPPQVWRWIYSLLCVYWVNNRVTIDAGSSAESVENNRSSGRTTYRKAYVQSIFDSIAGRYDLLNHTLSSGIDILWRRRLVRMLADVHPRRILDLATGTADLAIETARLNPEYILGIDISDRMLDIGRQKIIRRGLQSTITLEHGDAENLRFPDDSFDAVIAGFGVRNFETLERGLRESFRVLRTGGSAFILEFSTPRNAAAGFFYRMYSRYGIPLIGGAISQHRPAYEYLPSTVAEFPDGEAFCSILRNAGFTGTAYYPQTFGIATIYRARKENENSHEGSDNPGRPQPRPR